MRKLKVCHILFTMEGGAWALEQLRELRNQYDCEVTAVLNGVEGALVERLRAEDISVYNIDIAPNYLIPRVFFSLPKKY